MSMFCALPISVPAAPKLHATASAIRNGTGLSCLRTSATVTMGVKTKQTMSLFRNAERPPDTTIKINRNVAGWPSRAEMAPATRS